MYKNKSSLLTAIIIIHKPSYQIFIEVKVLLAFMHFDCSQKNGIKNVSLLRRSEAFFFLTELLQIKLLLDKLGFDTKQYT